MFKFVMPIKKDNDVAWYLAFAKDATSRHPLVAHVSVNYLEMSSSSSSVRENVDMSLNIGSSSSVSTASLCNIFTICSFTLQTF